MFSYKFGKKDDKNLQLEEGKLIEDLEVGPFNMIVKTYTECILQYQKAKPLEGIDTYGKKVADVYDDSIRAIQHTLSALASEVDHGNSLIAEARADLDMYHADKTNSYASHAFPTPFMSRFVHNLEKRKKNLSEAISEYENKLQEGKQTESPALLVQVLQEQNEAIVRCSSRVSEIQRKTDELRSFLQNRTMRSHSNLKYMDEDDSKRSVVSTVQMQFEQFLEERKRCIEKRDTTTNYRSLCEVPGNSGKYGIGGKKLGASFSNFGTQKTGAAASGAAASGAANGTKP